MAPTKNRKKNTGIRIVKKANKLVESRYKFDIWETRVFLSVLSQINREDDDFEVYRIWYKDVIKSFGLKSGQSYGLLRDAARGLMRKVFYVTNVEGGQKRETEYHIIRKVNYLKEGEKGGENQEYIEISIDPEMKPLLLQLGSNYKGEKGENFTAYDLRNVIKLGAYHVRIYELLKQYQKIGHRKIEVIEIKRMLEMTTEYPLFGNFFQKVIKPSVAAINKHTDLNITKLEKIKKGRKVDALYFEFKLKGNAEIKAVLKAGGGGVVEEKQAKYEEVSPQELKRDELFKKHFEVVVQKFGVTPSIFLNLLKSADEKTIEQAIRVTRRMQANNEIKKNIAGFFVKAIKEGYTDPKEEARKKKLKAEAAVKLIEVQIHELELERETKINEKIREVLELNPELTQEAINGILENDFIKPFIQKKEAELNRTLTLDDYRNDIQLRELVKKGIIELSKEQFADILSSYTAKIKKLKRNL